MLRALSRSVAPVDELVEQSSDLLDGARTAISGPPGVGPSGPAPSAATEFDTPDGNAAEDPFADDPLMDGSAESGEEPRPDDSTGGDVPDDGTAETDNPFDF
jgi:hypothetical protein